jgi:SpoVK/Ycf46/Vps4 family AAA+-type ATPase
VPHQVGGLSSRDNVAVVAATNRAQDVDEALLRRFHARIQVRTADYIHVYVSIDMCI